MVSFASSVGETAYAGSRTDPILADSRMYVERPLLSATLYPIRFYSGNYGYRVPK